MKLIFERSKEGRRTQYLPKCDVPVRYPLSPAREKAPGLACLSETETDRHYTQLAKQTYGVNDGFYPLGSCTMKYNPQINEEMASLPGFTRIHPLQEEDTVQGALEAMDMLEKILQERK